jgi:hypothetical protein
LLHGTASALPTLLHVEPGESQREDEEDAAEPTGDRLEHVGRLRTKKVVRHAATECCAEAFVFRPLHEHQQDDQQRDDHVDDQQNINQNRHEGGEYAGKRAGCKMEVCAGALGAKRRDRPRPPTRPRPRKILGRTSNIQRPTSNVEV